MKKPQLTRCKNNCLVLTYLENLMNFPLVRSIFRKLVACTRNYPYTNRYLQAKNQHLLEHGEHGEHGEHKEKS